MKQYKAHLTGNKNTITFFDAQDEQAAKEEAAFLLQGHLSCVVVEEIPYSAQQVLDVLDILCKLPRKASGLSGGSDGALYK